MASPSTTQQVPCCHLSSSLITLLVITWMSILVVSSSSAAASDSSTPAVVMLNIKMCLATLPVSLPNVSPTDILKPVMKLPTSNSLSTYGLHYKWNAYYIGGRPVNTNDNELTSQWSHPATDGDKLAPYDMQLNIRELSQRGLPPIDAFNRCLQMLRQPTIYLVNYILKSLRR